MISNLMWVVTGLSVLGTILNIKKKKICFAIWLFTNLAWLAYDLSIRSWPQAGLFGVYGGLAIWGIISWGRK